MADTASFPPVTVITPVYNGADFIAETIESVLAQDYPNLEYLVLDDGSTDNTAEIIRKYEGRLRFESHPNMGQWRTANKGIEMAAGEIIGIVNCDDPLLPGAISALVRPLMDNPQVQVVYPDWNMIDQDGKLVQHITTDDYSYVDMLRWHRCMPGPAAFFRRSLALDLGGRTSEFRYIGDFDFWLRAGLAGPFRRVPQRLATFRVHPGAEGEKGKGEAMAAEHLRLVRKIYALPHLPPEARRVRRQAFSSAYCEAGFAAGSNAPGARRRYFLMALILYPRQFLRERRELTPFMLHCILGPAYRPLDMFRVLLLQPRRAMRAITRRLHASERR